MYTFCYLMFAVPMLMATNPLPLGLLFIFIGLLAVVLAYITFEVYLAWSLFRYSVKRAKKDDSADTAYVP